MRSQVKDPCIPLCVGEDEMGTLGLMRAGHSAWQGGHGAVEGVSSQACPNHMWTPSSNDAWEREGAAHPTGGVEF